MHAHSLFVDAVFVFAGAVSIAGPTGPCSAGYYCTSQATNPQQFISGAGYYSPAGSAAPIPCAAGTYNPSTGVGACAPCPAGFLCPNQTTIITTPCPAGYYCPAGAFVATPCPAGTYSTQLALSNSTQCTACPPGQYCATLGLTAPTGNCSAGYYCSAGSDQSKPGASGVAVGFGAACPVGTFCPAGSAAPTPCPAGTFRSQTLGAALADCALCPPGQHCNATGLTAATGACSAGYYCVSGAASPAPAPTDATGGICPVANYCPAGASTPVPCAPVCVAFLFLFLSSCVGAHRAS
jgi:hypothetical protein